MNLENSSPRVLEAFLKDAIRLVDSVDGWVDQLIVRREAGSAAEVHRFFQTIHSIKGAASMIEPMRGIVEILQPVEEVLMESSIEALAMNAVPWVPAVEVAWPQLRQFLKDLKPFHSQLASVQSPPSMGRGLGLVWQSALRESERHWFLLAEVEKAINASELRGRRAFCYEGVWLPILGADEDCFAGLVVCLPIGRVVIRTQSVTVVTAISALEAEGYGKLETLVSDPVINVVRQVA